MPETGSRLAEKFERRLADRLVADGLVSRVRLEEALSLQVVTGGHLATSLWDAGVIDNARLSAVSSELLGVPQADVVQVATAKPDCLHALPIAFIKKSNIIPFAVDRQRLHVATSAPWDLAVLEEARFHAGKDIVPHYLSEVDQARLLDRLYQIRTPASFRLGPRQRLDAEVAADTPSPAPVAEDLVSEAAFAEQVNARTPGFSRHEDSADTLVCTPAPRVDAVLPELSLDDLLVSETPPVTLTPIADLAAARALLAAAQDREAVGDILTRFALSKGRRVVLLVKSGAFWTGWTGAGNGVAVAGIPTLMLPSEEGTIFGLVAQTDAHFIGPLADHPVHRFFLKLLGGVAPRTAGLLPVRYRGRLVFGIYLDSGGGALLSPDIADLLLLALHVPRALEQIVQRRLQSAPA